jgi:uncharacterized protein with PIN domain
MKNKTARFRFYEELNDFLPADKHKRDFDWPFFGKPTVKDAIEAIGVPHPEVDLVLVNGQSVDFSHHLHDRDRVSVYPVFESLDIRSVTHLRPEPLRESRFILDVHLGKTARWLRLLGFDCRYQNNFSDCEIIDIAGAENRIILTRDQQLLKHGRVLRGHWVRATGPFGQLAEIIDRFDLRGNVRPFSRCMLCNTELEPVAKALIESRIPPRTRENQHEFYICHCCDKIYWPGTHFLRMQQKLANLNIGAGDEANH